MIRGYDDGQTRRDATDLQATANDPKDFSCIWVEDAASRIARVDWQLRQVVHSRAGI